LDNSGGVGQNIPKPAMPSAVMEDVIMLVRIGLPAMAVMAAAWTLVQPDTPRPADTGAAVQQAAAEIEEAPSSAIELLGETWTVDAPAPIVRPLSAAEHAEVIAAMRRSDDGVAAAPAASEGIAALRRPVPRPTPRPEHVARAEMPVDYSAPVAPSRSSGRSIVVSAPGGAPLSDPPPVIALRGQVGSDAPRWVVRQQGSGRVIAEVPLAEALAILTSR
jgi:hypothetical protein